MGLNKDDQVWDATAFTKNRDRPLGVAVAKEFPAQEVGRPRTAGLIPDEHFTVDGTLLDAWASLKSFQPKDKQDAPPPDDSGNPTVESTERSAPTKRTNRSPIRTHCWHAMATARSPSRGTTAICW